MLDKLEDWRGGRVKGSETPTFGVTILSCFLEDSGKCRKLQRKQVKGNSVLTFTTSPTQRGFFFPS